MAGFSYGFVILGREYVGQKSKRKIEGGELQHEDVEIERPLSFGFSEWRQRALFYRENGDKFLERDNSERVCLLFFRLGKFQHFRGPHQPLRFSLSKPDLTLLLFSSDVTAQKFCKCHVCNSLCGTRQPLMVGPAGIR